MSPQPDLLAHDRFDPPSGSAATTTPGAPATVVLLHPSAFGPDVLRPLAQRLAATHPVIVPHRRGYGRSAALGPPSSLDDHHADLLALLDDLELARPVIVGASAGATLALGFARFAPGRAALVIAHEPLIGPLAPTLDARVRARIARLLERSDQRFETSLFMSELVGITTWNHLQPAWRDAVEANGPVACTEAGLFAGFALTEDDIAALATHPVATTVGGRSSEMRVEASTALAQRGVTCRVVPDVAHLPPVEAPGPYAALIDELIAELAGGQFDPTVSPPARAVAAGGGAARIVAGAGPAAGGRPGAPNLTVVPPVGPVAP